MYLVKPWELKIILSEIERILNLDDPEVECGRRILASVVSNNLHDVLSNEIPYVSMMLLPLKEWSKYSGDVLYPVPSVDLKTPESSYLESYESCTLWDKKDPYGQLVHESNLFIRDFFRSLVKNNECLLVKNLSFEKIAASQEEKEKDYAAATKQLTFY